MYIHTYLCVHMCTCMYVPYQNFVAIIKLHYFQKSIFPDFWNSANMVNKSNISDYHLTVHMYKHCG